MAIENELELLNKIVPWKRRGERAPHKPLLILLALGRLSRGMPAEMPFSVIEPKLRSLLTEFGPSRQSYHPEYPFWALQQNGVWNLESKDTIILRKGSSNPSKGELLKQEAVGSLTPSIIKKLTDDPKQIATTAKKLLSAHFPESLHSDISNAVGLDLSNNQQGAAKRPRDPKFREE
jgi:putative restriction endonuclease